MARGVFTLFQVFVADLGNAEHNLGSDTFKLGIVDDTITPTAADTTPAWGDYSANEVSADGNYTTGGVTIPVSWGQTSGVGTFNDNSGDISWSLDASGFTNGYWGILYNDTNASDLAIGFLDLGGPVSEVSGPISITWNGSGIFTVTIS